MSSNTTRAVRDGYWEDATGALIPADKVKDIDKARDKAVRTMIDQAIQLSQVLAQFKLASLSEIQTFIDKSGAEYGAKKKPGGKKGNVTLVTFDGRFKVVRAMQETLVFDERLQVAKELIDERVHVWAKGANKNIQALVNHAFQVDKEGKISTGRVLSLRQLKIDDPGWAKAMEAISDSMKAASSKPQLRFYERNEDTGEYVGIPLAVAAT